MYRATRWVVGLAFAAVVIFLFYRFFPWYAFRFDQLDPRLPEAFHYDDSPWIFWGWVLVLLTVAVLTVLRLRTFLRRQRSALGLGTWDVSPGRGGRTGRGRRRALVSAGYRGVRSDLLVPVVERDRRHRAISRGGRRDRR